ncbi:hypothetical protein RHGRI_006086 [Rhododendron griersonianum]|uniref:non-specific serine/threonine protein kinase n=1 Tax=Rhododendron griersonianum TaxID=479676 RepID=A0AAV6LEI8_9ERIC|nr:hypothetical protein RHGRI_006086 [Rhododendron griersonianum]
MKSGNNNFSSSTCTKSAGEATRVSILELRRFSAKNEFKLEGATNGDDSMSFTLCVVQPCCDALNFHFPFYLAWDTPKSIATELVEHFDLSNEDLTLIAELIGSSIVDYLKEKKNNCVFVSYLLLQSFPFSKQKATLTSFGDYAKSAGEATHVSDLELWRINGKNEFKLEGVINGDDSISFTLRTIQSCCHARNIRFVFYLARDTAQSIAGEMVFQRDLSNEDLTFIAQLVDSLIRKFVPNWKPSFGNSRSKGSPCEDSPHLNNQSPMRCSWASRSERISGEGIFKEHDSTSYANKEVFRSEWNMSSNGFEGCKGRDGDQRDELKLELDAIDMQYRRSFNELLRMREEAMENVKKKWM